jgi:L-amino acid N-acyltransferase YncA
MKANETESYPGTQLIRDATESDITVVQHIYAHYVLNDLATFEEVPPSVEEMVTRYRAIMAAGLPYLVAELDGNVVGYSYATPYRPRPAYRYTVEDSVYVANALRGRGIGGALLQTLVPRCETGPSRQMLAVIGNSENAGSMALHRRMGFQLVGTFRIGRLQAGPMGRYGFNATSAWRRRLRVPLWRQLTLVSLSNGIGMLMLPV